jgi:hypothetical protein
MRLRWGATGRVIRVRAEVSVTSPGAGLAVLSAGTGCESKRSACNRRVLAIRIKSLTALDSVVMWNPT